MLWLPPEYRLRTPHCMALRDDDHGYIILAVGGVSGGVTVLTLCPYLNNQSDDHIDRYTMNGSSRSD